MVDWKLLGGISAIGGLIGYFGAKKLDEEYDFSQKSAESIQFNAWTDPISERQKWRISQEGGEHSKGWTRGEANKYIKQLLNDKPKVKKPVQTKKKSMTNRNPLSIIPTTFTDDIGVIFNENNDEVIGAVAINHTKTTALLVGNAQQEIKDSDLKMIDSKFVKLWFAWKQEPLIMFENHRVIVGVEGIINYKIRPFSIEGCKEYKGLTIPSKPVNKIDTYKTIGELKKPKDSTLVSGHEYLEVNGWGYELKNLKKVISKIPVKDTFESYFNNGLWVLEGADWTLYLAGRKI